VSPAVTAAQSLRRPFAEAAQFADRAGLSLAGPGFQAFAAAVAEHVREATDQVTGSFELGTAGGDLRERGAVCVGEVTGRGEDPAGRFLGCGRWRWRGDGGVAAQLCGEPAQGAQAAEVAAAAQLGVQPLGAADPVIPSLPQPVLVRAEQARAGSGGRRGSAGRRPCGGVAADCLGIQP
jgi:hypothetical protein